MPPGGDSRGHGSGFGQPGPYVQGTMSMGGTGWNPTGAGGGGRGSLEMPNIAGLGLSGNHQVKTILTYYCILHPKNVLIKLKYVLYKIKNICVKLYLSFLILRIRI